MPVLRMGRDGGEREGEKGWKGGREREKICHMLQKQ